MAQNIERKKQKKIIKGKLKRKNQWKNVKNCKNSSNKIWKKTKQVGDGGMNGRKRRGCECLGMDEVATWPRDPVSLLPAPHAPSATSRCADDLGGCEGGGGWKSGVERKRCVKLMIWG